MSFWDKGNNYTDCIITIVLLAIGKESWIVSTIGIKKKIIENICSIKKRSGKL